MSTPHSPPDSPPAAMAVESGAVTLRKRLSDAPAKSDNNGVLASETVNPIQPGEVIQVPSTNPANERQSENQTEDIRVEEEEDEPKEEAVNDSDLARFDWEDLQARYTKALQEANDEEDKILEEFNNFAEVGLRRTYSRI
jgi:LysM repeat protein